MHSSVNVGQRYLWLDLIRGAAAISVVAFHLLEQAGLPKILSGGFLSVDLFFLISGFVIASTYEGKLNSGEMNFSKFAFGRLWRLYPLYMISISFGIIYTLARIAAGAISVDHIDQIFLSIPFAILILPNPFSSPDFPGTFPFSGSAWSLSLEIWFNFAYGILFYRLPKSSLFLVSLFAAIALVFLSQKDSTIDLGWGWENFLGGVARYWFSFLVIAHVPGRTAMRG